MTLPFIHTTVSGLHFAGTELIWVSGTRLGSRLSRLQGVQEAVEDGDVAAALIRLVERVKPPTPYVVTHLDPLYVRHMMVQGPAFDDEDGMAAWVQQQARHLLPPGAVPDDFVFRPQLIEQTEEHTRCLFAFARREAVEACEALLEAAGLRPLCISSLDIATGEAMRVETDFAEGRTAVLLLKPDDAALLHYQGGMLQTLLPLPFGTAGGDVAALLEETMTHLTPPDRMFVMGAGAAAFVAQARAMHLVDWPVREGRMDLASYVASPPLSEVHQPAVAMTLQQLFAFPETLNFMSPETAYAWFQESEKHEAIRAVLFIGGVVGMLYLLLTCMTFYVTVKQMESEATLQQHAGLVADMDAAQEALKQLTREVDQAERLVVERTHVAGVLERIGRGLSQGLWLETVTLNTDTPDAAHLTLAGVAQEGGNVALYLQYLEDAAFATNVRLVVTEAVQATTLYRNGNVRNQPLTRFEIAVTLAKPSQNTLNGGVP